MKIKYLLLALAFVSLSFTHHIIKISNTTISKESGKLKFHIKIFADDLTDNINSTQKTKSNFCKATLTATDKKTIENYVKSNFTFYKNGVLEPLVSSSITTDLASPDNIVVDVVFKSKNLVAIKKGDVLKVKNTILFQNIPEQKNMVTLLNLLASEIEVLSFSNQDKETVKEYKY
jgi:hypothetical protein